jgi:hypothetical protein
MAVKGKRGNFSKEVVEEAKRTGEIVEDFIPTEGGEPIKDLKANKPEPEVPRPVRNGHLQAAYVLPHYRIHKDLGQVVEMEFSFPLTGEHKGNLPDGVEEAWKFIDKKNYPSIDVSAIPPQTVTIRKAPDMKRDDYMLHLASVLLVKAKLKKVEEKGKGHVKTVMRFSFRMLCEVTEPDVCKFADRQFGKDVWLEMSETQGKLKLD